MTILDGCQLATVQMKYPSRAVYSQTKLVALLGHGYKKDDKNVVLQHNSILKTGMFMIFQGKKNSSLSSGVHFMLVYVKQDTISLKNHLKKAVKKSFRQTLFIDLYQCTPFLQTIFSNN